MDNTRVLLNALVLFVFLGIVALFGFYIVRQQTAVIIERWGKMVKIARPGLAWRIPLIDKIVGLLSLEVQRLDVKVKTRTRDNAFISIIISVQYCVIDSKIADVFYGLQQPELKIRGHVDDIVRSKILGIKLDAVFETKDDVAQAVRLDLTQKMNDSGYKIVEVVVTDIDPDAKSAANLRNLKSY